MGRILVRRDGPWGGLMSAVAIDDKAVPGAPPPVCQPREYLYNLNKTAIYVAARGLPFLLVTHAIFLVRYIDEWVEKDKRNAVDAAGALFGRWPKWSQKLIAEWLQKTWLPSGILLTVLLAPYVLPLAVVLPYQVGRSVLSSTWDIFRNGIRALPPLVTAVVVVFVTSDAWRILGNGSANRFRLLIAVFVAASLLFLIRWRCWDDIDVSPKQADKLLGGITLKRPTGFRAFIDPDYGVQPAPINRPGPLGTAWVYTGYWLLAAFALLMTMAFVALALIVVGVIQSTRTRRSRWPIRRTFTTRCPAWSSPGSCCCYPPASPRSRRSSWSRPRNRPIGSGSCGTCWSATAGSCWSTPSIAPRTTMPPRGPRWRCATSRWIGARAALAEFTAGVPFMLHPITSAAAHALDMLAP